jgi:tetratricopeptide (TPR) repeat protein
VTAAGGGRSGGTGTGEGRPLGLAAALVLVAALVAAAHWPVLGAQAVSFDDDVFVRDNVLVTQPGWESASRFFREVLEPSTVKGYYLPLSMTSLMLDYAMGGRPDDLHVFHRTSLALHAVCALLIVLLLYRLFGALVPAVIGGLLFGLHPLTVEPVAWVGERKTLLASAFAFACLLCYVQHCRGRGRGWLASSVALHALALLSKPTVTMLPLLLLLLDWWPLKRLRVRAVVEKWPFFLLSLLFGVVTVVSHRRTAGILPLTPEDFLQWPLRAGYLLGFYVGKIVRPTDLSCAYPAPAPVALSNPAVLFPVIVACVLTVLAVLALRRTRGPLAGWLFFVVGLAPTLGLVGFSWVIASDKYVYFPVLGILLVAASALAAGWTSPRLGGFLRRALLLLPVLLILGAEWRGVRATLRNWGDSMTLARHMERTAPASPAVQVFLGNLLDAGSAPEEALLHLRRAVDIAPDYFPARQSLGVVLARHGHAAESLPHLRRAAELRPEDFDAAYALGNSLRFAGRPEEAEVEFRRALRLQPGSLGALDQLGSVLYLQGRAAESAEQFRRAVALAPDNSLMHYRLAMALTMLGGHAAEAADHLRHVARIRPDSPQPLVALAWLLATCPEPGVRDAAEAMRLATRAAELTGGRDPTVLDALAAAQAAGGRYAEAARTARAALALALRQRADAVARGLRERLALYERGRAYLAPAGAPP